MYFGDDTTAVGARPVTSTDSACARSSSTAASGEVRRNVTLVPASRASSARSMEKRPVTPGD